MKLNNKGYLLVEIVVCSVITLIISYFLIDITIDFKDKYEIVFYENQYRSYNEIINKNIMDDVEKYQLKGVTFTTTNNKNIVNFTYYIDKKDVVKTLTITQISNNKLKYQYGVFINNAYDITKHYYEKEINGLSMANNSMTITNYCYGNAIEKNGICVRNAEYNGETLLKNSQLVINFAVSSPFITDFNIRIVIPYNNFETVIQP